MTTQAHRIVDFHVHAFPDDLAERALKALIETYKVPTVTDGTVKGLTEHMRASGVNYSIIQPVATKPTQVRQINDWVSKITEPGVVCFGAIHPDCDDVPGEIERIISLGLPGIKIQANWQGVDVDDPKMFPIYDAVQGRLIVMFHAGREIADFGPIRACPKRLANVHREFPKMTMIAAHMGGYKMWDEVEEYLVGKQIFFDTSACPANDIPDDRLLSLIRRHGVERVLFATDSPFGDARKDISRLLRLGLKDSELEMIFWQNAEALLGNHLTGRPGIESAH